MNLNINCTGNIRELRNMMERFVILSDQKFTVQELFAFGVANVTKDPMDQLFNHFELFFDFRDQMEKRYIEYKLPINGWKFSKTADEIDMQSSSIKIQLNY